MSGCQISGQLVEAKESPSSKTKFPPKWFDDVWRSNGWLQDFWLFWGTNIFWRCLCKIDSRRIQDLIGRHVVLQPVWFGVLRFDIKPTNVNILEAKIYIIYSKIYLDTEHYKTIFLVFWLMSKNSITLTKPKNNRWSTPITVSYSSMFWEIEIISWFPSKHLVTSLHTKNNSLKFGWQTSAMDQKNNRDEDAKKNKPMDSSL